MDLSVVRRIIITAIASDDLLVSLLVLKGGNALELVHHIGGRASLDLDYSIEGDFEDPKEIGERLSRALRDRFDAAGFEVFDYKFAPRPSVSPAGSKWGGYTAEFKLISREQARILKNDLTAMRIQSHVVSETNQRRVFSIDISKHEYCNGKMLADVDAFDCYVYTPAMIAIEKLRALCQQSPEYPQRKHAAPRARDFYDIYSIVKEARIEIREHADMLRHMFAAKEVDLSLLDGLRNSREFHRQGWPAVENSVQSRLNTFDVYFDFVMAEIEKLEVVRNP